MVIGAPISMYIATYASESMPWLDPCLSPPPCDSMMGPLAGGDLGYSVVIFSAGERATSMVWSQSYGGVLKWTDSQAVMAVTLR